jgi:DNA-binding transcriptional ArsR family regulator
MTPAATIDTLMRTLADPTRRAVFERVVRASEITVGDLTRGSGVTQGAISQHLKTLRLAGLVVERPEGRKVYYRAEPAGLTPLVDWMDCQTARKRDPLWAPKRDPFFTVFERRGA